MKFVRGHFRIELPLIAQAKALNGKRLATLDDSELRTFEFYAVEGYRFGVKVTLQGVDGKITVTVPSEHSVAKMIEPITATKSPLLSGGKIPAIDLLGARTKREITIRGLPRLGQAHRAKG